VETGQPHTSFGFLGEEAFKSTRFYQRAAAPFGVGDSALIVLEKSVRQFGALSIQRHCDVHPFGEGEMALLRLLSPHIRRAVMIADLLDARALERDMLSAALDRLAVGIVLTDAEGRIAHTNEAADRIFDDGSIVRRVVDQLAARDSSASRELAQAIADAASGTTVDLPRSGIVVPLKGEAGRDLAAWVLPLDSGLRRQLAAGFAARVAIFIRELGDTSPFPAELFVRRYAITPAESRVMLLIVQGMTVAEAAETLGISLPTAKTHLARLFDKTGTSRQADLVRLAMSALAPTG
jgi:DNA-binding CsgD family transcriptional regulator/PAS domain-containing protein